MKPTRHCFTLPSSPPAAFVTRLWFVSCAVSLGGVVPVLDALRAPPTRATDVPLSPAICLDGRSLCLNPDLATLLFRAAPRPERSNFRLTSPRPQGAGHQRILALLKASRAQFASRRFWQLHMPSRRICFDPIPPSRPGGPFLEPTRVAEKSGEGAAYRELPPEANAGLGMKQPGRGVGCMPNCRPL